MPNLGVIQPAFADGGYAEDDDYDSVAGQGSDDATIDPMQYVTAALNYGKKKYGIPTDDDQMGFNDGGVVPTQPDEQVTGGGNPAAGPDPRQAMAYLSGDGAVSAEVAQALEQRIDPQGQMNPTQRATAAIGVAPNDEAKFGLLQHYRSKFNAYAGATKAALNRGDLGEAARSATMAMDAVPNGQRTQFAPMQGGLAMMSKPAFARGGGRPQQQSFDDGGFVKTVYDWFNRPKDPNSPVPDLPQKTSPANRGPFYQQSMDREAREMPEDPRARAYREKQEPEGDDEEQSYAEGGEVEEDVAQAVTDAPDVSVPEQQPLTDDAQATMPQQSDTVMDRPQPREQVETAGLRPEPVVQTGERYTPPAPPPMQPNVDRPQVLQAQDVVRLLDKGFDNLVSGKDQEGGAAPAQAAAAPPAPAGAEQPVGPLWSQPDWMRKVQEGAQAAGNWMVTPLGGGGVEAKPAPAGGDGVVPTAAPAAAAPAAAPVTPPAASAAAPAAAATPAPGALRPAANPLANRPMASGMSPVSMMEGWERASQGQALSPSAQRSVPGWNRQAGGDTSAADYYGRREARRGGGGAPAQGGNGVIPTGKAQEPTEAELRGAGVIRNAPGSEWQRRGQIAAHPSGFDPSGAPAYSSRRVPGYGPGLREQTGDPSFMDPKFRYQGPQPVYPTTTADGRTISGREAAQARKNTPDYGAAPGDRYGSGVPVSRLDKGYSGGGGGGIRGSASAPGPSGGSQSPEQQLENQASRLFPAASQAAQRQDFINRGLGQLADRATKESVETIKGNKAIASEEGKDERARLERERKEKKDAGDLEFKREREGRYREAASSKERIAQQNQLATTYRAQVNNVMSMARTLATARPDLFADPDKASQTITQMARQQRINPQAMHDLWLNGGTPFAPGGAGGGAPAPSSGGGGDGASGSAPKIVVFPRGPYAGKPMIQQPDGSYVPAR